MDHITDMIEDALRRIRIGEPEAAVWRLVEAAGLLATDLQQTYPDQVGFTQPTGRGFQVTRTKGSASRVQLVKDGGSHVEPTGKADGR